MATYASATPAAGEFTAKHMARDTCGDDLGRCDQNGCGGLFSSPNNVFGTCTTGKFTGCPCRKCGGKGSCGDNGCFGKNGICTQGLFQGCACS
ncbi:hypothetical protein P154DRAFT_579171 [Amniculicola lignicola CBS 123094]|uniref:Uncharacterized protein n=1 Tax=Amniculicola lignicola CBS 123094 TaxID=1392246 RepID=A0A6A5W905_9PLEO|nr:hypothetical protein P154DRAFT_579171 [Amniculicola lignicola CBS 123094]